MVVNIEVGNLSSKVVQSWNPDRTTRIFNADLTIIDAQENVRPYLAEALPQLDTSSWQVFPDGRMETTWRLRPGLTWQDGQPLTSEDFVFAYQISQAPELAGFFVAKLQNLIDEVAAVDSWTIRISWRSSFFHKGEGLEPLPRHILSEPFAAFKQDPRGQTEAFTSLRYWTSEYVGAGPFRLTNWEFGSHIEGAAFDGHALGKPKIDRVVIRIIPDNNAALANVLAGEVQFTMAQSIRFEQAMILHQHGGFNDTEGKGRLLFAPTSAQTMAFQHRPEYQLTPGLLDVRVRKAVLYAMDRDAIGERLFEGQSTTPISFVFPKAAYYGQIDRAVTKYPYDLRAAEQLMAEAGYARGRDGVLVSSGGQRFQPSLWTTGDALHQTMAAIVLDNWRQAGIDAERLVTPPSVDRDQETYSTFPGIRVSNIGGVIVPLERTSLNNLISEEIATPTNRWSGQNKGGWSNADFDNLWDRYKVSLDRAEQVRLFVQMMKIHSEQVPNYPLYFTLNVVTHVASLRGPEGDSTHWNIHEWEFTS
jgi:peptide/nickel transport system substrate-binding protein